jgi:hypothetical protein
MVFTLRPFEYTFLVWRRGLASVELFVFMHRSLR